MENLHYVVKTLYYNDMDILLTILIVIYKLHYQKIIIKKPLLKGTVYL